MPISFLQRSQVTSAAETNSVDPHTHVGYCHEITVRLLPDGSTNPTSIQLGNKGDVNITKITFDTTELLTASILDPTVEYIGRVVIYDPTLPRNRYATNPNPATYNTVISSPSYTWAVPEFWTSKSGTFQLIFAILERTASSHSTTEQETFITNIVSSIVADSNWSSTMQTAINNALVITDTAEYLLKTAVTLVPTEDHYKLVPSSTNIGDKLDSYIKRIQLDNGTTALDEGLDERYGVFIQGSTYQAIKFNTVARSTTTSVCWIPANITTLGGTWSFTLVAQTEDVDYSTINDDGFKRWVSNTLQFTVVNNFLETGDLDIEVAGSNFALSDGSILTTSDGNIFIITEV